MYGWRAKIGLITPMSENAEHAFHIYAPEGVTFASMKINFPGPTPEGLMVLTDRLEETAAMYKGYNDMDLVVFGCTSGSCIKGVGWDQECINRIERASGIPGLTTSTAVLEALHAVGAKKVAVLTPYPEATNDAEKKFLEDNGFAVTNIIGVDMGQFCKDGQHGFENADEHFLYQNARNMDLKGADTFFLSCMGLTTMEIIDALETTLEIPVITSHQATLWSALRHCRVGAKLPKLGKLFTL
ncbi:aspartate/glutamate racemase family protein [uncultured Dysosmobacter sp.]|uniref:maleate cis-trans isomerase family protein n=1 Tax=uncultured Dysosmobacter sp. TaxID=2591384 RepID=UPI00260EF10B|nr:aspartate/glutamate racemase family protein [uncultured Dysosmobacter sp.]